MRAVPADAQEPAFDERNEVGGLDDPKPAPRAGIASQHGGGREEQLVHTACLEERAERMRACLAEDSTMTASLECVENRSAWEAVARAE